MSRRDSNPQRARTTAKIQYYGARPAERDRLGHQELRTPPGHENARINLDAQAAELRPAENVFERKSIDPLIDQLGEFGVVAGSGDEQGCFVLGEDAAGGAEGGDDDSGFEK
ncbi:hypothetical protein GCM10009744_46010 [Kribbella alba]|uniref:Uncharacterized protein n=1 Tax=Kribbella alba TaxID=190197 RepID=A0ABP4RJ78_9ACTN